MADRCARSRRADRLAHRHRARADRETAHACTLVFDVPGWPGHRAGQHVDVRLTAEDGYQAERSLLDRLGARRTGALALTVERIDDGEVSPYLADELPPGDEFELRGPIGGYFTWDAERRRPAAAASPAAPALVPLMAMLRHHAARAAQRADARLLVSARTRRRPALPRASSTRLAARDGVRVHYAHARRSRDGWDGDAGRVDARDAAAVGPPPAARPRVYVCGPTPFVEARRRPARRARPRPGARSAPSASARRGAEVAGPGRASGASGETCVTAVFAMPSPAPRGSGLC